MYGILSVGYVKNKISIDDRAVTLTKIVDNFTSLKELIKTLDTCAQNELTSKVDLILEDFYDTII